MSLPGYPDGFSPGWWRIVTDTPPIYTGYGTLDGSTSVANFTGYGEGGVFATPIVGTQVAGEGIPANTTIAAVVCPLPLIAPSVFTLTLSQAPTSAGVQLLTIGCEPVSVAEAKKWARIEYSNDDADLLPDLIQMARMRVEADLGRAIITQHKTLYFMAFPWSGYYTLAIRGMGLNPWWFPYAQGVFKLPYPMLQMVDFVSYIDSGGNPQTLAPSFYTYTPAATPGRLQPAYGNVWPVARPQVDAVQIGLRIGYGSLSSNVPAPTRLAMRALIAANYQQRESVTSETLTTTPLYDDLLGSEEYGRYE